MSYKDTDIAVVGMAGRFPGAGSVGEFWRNLREGVESVTWYDDAELEKAGVPRSMIDNPNYIKAGCPLSEMEQFDAGFFGMNPQEARVMDPQHRHFLECVWEAIEDAGHVPARFPGPIGVFAGSGHNAYMPYNLMTNPDVIESMGFFLVRHTGNDKDFLATRASFLFNLKGPSVNVQTACSTSLVAIHTACQSLIAGECDMALAGGVTIELPHRHGYLYRDSEILAPDGHCRAFDAESGGTLFGSGVGIVVLRPINDALEDGDYIRAVIKGSAINNDGAMKAGYLAPSVDGQAEAIAEAIEFSEVDPETISYIESHGTGTRLGDPIEVAALTQAFRRHTSKVGFCGIGSLKTNIGHLDTAAGVAGFIKAAAALENEELPPSLHFNKPNPECQFETSPFFVNAELREWKRADGRPRRAGVSSLGVGGTNAHIVLEEAPQAKASGPSRPYQLLTISAKTKPALDQATQRFREHLKSNPGLSLADCAYTLQTGREAMKWRRTLSCGDVADAVETLASPDSDRVHTAECGDGRPSAAFMFAGGGAQHPNMGLSLYQTEPVYRDAVDKCLEIFARHIEADLRKYLFPEPGEEEAAAAQLERPSIGLPALVLTQYAQAQLWKSWGIEPSALIGHSMGEYTAAHLAGVMNLDDTLALVSLRGRLFETIAPGGMLSVSLSEEELTTLLGDELSIAAVNGPALCVASGPNEALSRLQSDLEARDVECVRVRIAIAAHSSMLEPILEEFGAFFKTIKLAAPEFPVASNLSGDWLTAEQATDSGYWVRQLRHTVRFSDGLKLLLSDPNRVLVEVGAGRTLSTLATQHPDRQTGQVVLNSLPHPKDPTADLAYMLAALGRLWSAGLEPKWDKFYQGEERAKTPLPTYPFEHKRHWVEPGQPSAAGAQQSETDASARKSDIGDWTYEVSWKRRSALAQTGSSAVVDRTLVFLDEVGFGERLVEHLRSSRTVFTSVRRAESFARVGSNEYTVNPDSPGDFTKLLSAMAEESGAPQEIIYLWPLSPDRGGQVDAEALREAESSCFQGLVNIAKALGEEDVSDPLRLWVISNNMQRVVGETVLEPAKALLLGPALVIPREFPNVASCSVDVQLPPLGSGQEGMLLDQLCRELEDVPSDEVIAFRGLDRWARSLEPCRLPLVPEKVNVRENGVYLITGGLGGIGLTLAEHLARNYKAKLVLVGRTALPPREQWGNCDPSFAGKIEKVKALEALGAEVTVSAADVADGEQVRGVIADTKSRFGVLHGVIHAAGVIDDAPLQLKTAESTAAVMRPKTHGTLALHEATKEEPLDFVVLFSSVSAMAGLAGQVDYTAANAFLDAFAECAKVQGGASTLSIDWSAWRDVGMTTGAVADAEPVPVDHPLLDECVRTPEKDSYRTRFNPDRQWVLNEHRLKTGAALIPGAGFMELACAAGEASGLALPLELQDVNFLAPFFVADGAEEELQIEVSGMAEEKIFSIVSRVVTDQGTFLRDYVQGKAAVVEKSSQAAILDLDQVRRRCTETRTFGDADDLSTHLAFGPRWHNLKTRSLGAGEALLELELHEEFLPDTRAYRLHPALLDIATAGAQELVPDFEPDRDFYVPLSYGTLRIEKPIEGKVFSHIRYKSGDEGADGLASFDVSVVDILGLTLVEISDFVMIRLEGTTQLAAQRDGDTSRMRPAMDGEGPAGASRPAIDLSNAIGPEEGMEVFDRLMSARNLSQVVVCPENVESMIAQLRSMSAAPAPSQQQQEDEPSVDIAAAEEGMARIEEILESAVAEHKEPSGEKRLVGYFVCDDDEDVTSSEIRRLLRRDGVTDELIPRMFIELDKLPRNGQDEIDRKALRNPFGPAIVKVPPATETEKLIAGIWQDLLGIDEISIHEKFLEIGGHSLLALRLITRLSKQLNVRLQPDQIIVHTLEQLAAICEEQVPGHGDKTDTPAATSQNGNVGTVRETVVEGDRI